MMTGKERMMTALQKGKPDRLPITIHQWQAYHLKTFMKGADQLGAFLATGLDASVTPWNLITRGESPDWRECRESYDLAGYMNGERRVVKTPDGDITWITAGNEYTRFVVEHPLKTEKEVKAFLKHLPPGELDKEALSRCYDKTSDHGIVRGFVDSLEQPGPWQEFCELAGTEDAILWALDEPDLVHFFLSEITKWKVEYVLREMDGARFDLIEHGGGAASSTVISPSMFEEFCLPYDRQIIDALHSVGLPVVYHTCGGMKPILELIPQNGCNASETLSPPGVGGDIENGERAMVKDALGSKVALIGGVDQNGILDRGTKEDVRKEVLDCFETYGKEGGYLCSASDHFFHTPVENLVAMGQAARECLY